MLRIEKFRDSMHPVEVKNVTRLADPARFDYIWMPWEDVNY